MRWIRVLHFLCSLLQVNLIALNKFISWHQIQVDWMKDPHWAVSALYCCSIADSQQCVWMWMCVLGTLVPASSLEALHQLLSHDSNKNKSQVVISSGLSIQDTAAARSSSVARQSLVPVSSSSNLFAPLSSSSTQQNTHSWPTSTKHLSMPSLVEFL